MLVTQSMGNAIEKPYFANDFGLIGYVMAVVLVDVTVATVIL